VWCIGMSRPPGPKMEVTKFPSQSTCANCLTKMRSKKTGKYKPVKLKHIFGRKTYYEREGIVRTDPLVMREERQEEKLAIILEQRQRDDETYCGGCGMMRSQCQCWDAVNQTYRKIKT